ncbi:MAG: Crp/Fnr family transcriptional regulator [Pedobacter sp.]|nr:Crp/Fnr family transcriptional regulator [Pedobacter sp.]MDQ8052651.1 Crp/Fnr family transcriptional regulator [Pedobacter sp.]
MNLAKLKKMVYSILPMDEEAWQAGAALFKEKKLRSREYFLRQGEICRYVGFICEGYTRLFYDLETEEVTKDFNLENAFCGSYASFISESPSHFNVVAMEPLTLLVITKPNLMALADRYMDWQKILRIAMEQNFISKENREALFLTANPEARYADLLQHKMDWVKRIPLKYLASYLGMSAETLSRIRARK